MQTLSLGLAVLLLTVPYQMYGAVLGNGESGGGPGTYFNPENGNSVSASVALTNAVARRTIGFLGGSITEMNGFRPLLMSSLRMEYPDVEFVEIAAGLSSTCSDTGAFRLERDVFRKGIPDVLIVDVAVNDDQDGHFDVEHCIRGLEGIVRHMLMVNPQCLVVIAEMVNKIQYDQISCGQEPIPYIAGRIVARHYGAVLADIGSALVASAKSGGLSWEGYRDCHPSPEGCAFGARVILKAINSTVDFKKAMPRQSLPEPIDRFSYCYGRELDFASVCEGDAWKVEKPDWDVIPGLKRAYFTQGEALCCARTNELLTVRFSGTALAALLTAGPDAGDMEVSVDGKIFRRIPLRADYGSLHYPYTQMLADDLVEGSHEVRIRVLPVRRKLGLGTNVRINRLCANEVTGNDAFQHRRDRAAKRMGN